MKVSTTVVLEASEVRDLVADKAKTTLPNEGKEYQGAVGTKYFDEDGKEVRVHTAVVSFEGAAKRGK